MQGYDLDDTLAAVNFAAAAERGMATVFAQARVIYTPNTDFIVISARPHSTSAMRTATENWLQENQPHFKGIYYVSGTEAEIINKKAQIINEKRLTDFTDNNRDILAKLKDQVPNTQLWVMTAQGRTKWS